MRKLEQADNLQGKTVILRLDLNMPVKAGKFVDLTRLKRSIPTINHFINSGCKVVIISHMGRPKGEFIRSLSLGPFVDEIEKLLNKKIRFATDCIGQKVKGKIASMNPGDIILLENLRFHIGEENNTPEFAGQIASLGDIFVNDAFSCSHRSHASVEGITKFLPSFAGVALASELENIEKLLSKPEKTFTALVGGSKISTKLNLLSTFLDKVDYLILGGGIANTCLQALGHDLGSSLVDLAFLAQAEEIMKKAKNTQVLLPEDFVVKGSSGKISIKKLSNIAPDDMIMDVGPHFSAKAAEIINNSKTVIWNGPLGVVESPEYVGSSSYIARHIASSTQEGKIKSIIGGGDTTALLQTLGLIDCVTYTSTGGGAFLAWLEGEPLPGIAALSK